MDFAQLKKDCEGFCNVILYSKLKGPIEKHLKGTAKACIILVLFQETNGHYVCVYQEPKNPKCICFFDPFGDKNYFGTRVYNNRVPINPEINKKLGQDKPLLFMSFLASKKYNLLEYNDYALQDVKALNCGAWSVLRILYRTMTFEEFYKKFAGCNIAVAKFGAYLSDKPYVYSEWFS